MADPFQSGYAFMLDQINGVAENRGRRQAGAALAGGDYASAAAQLYRMGDLKGGAGVQDRQAEMATRDQATADAARIKQIDFTLKATSALKDVRAKGGNVLEAYQSFAPAFLQMGVPEDQIAQIGQALQQDPNFLDKIEQVAGAEKRKLTFQKAGDDVVVYEDGNPNPVSTYVPEGKPIVANGLVLGPDGKTVLTDARQPQFKTVGEGQSLVQTGGPAEPALDIGRAEQLALAALPGARVTSGARTPAHNAEVGGVANSYHLSGQARDLSIPQGMSPAQAAQQVQANLGPGWEVINEGDHIHIEPAPKSGGGARVIAQGAPKQRYRNATPQEIEAAGLPPGTPAQISPQGQIQPFTNGANLKPIPAVAARAMADTNSAVQKIDEALAVIEAYPQGLGLMNNLGDTVRQRTDPKGVNVRAAVADIGSQIIHDRSGAAVTISETPRLRPFVPDVRDTPETVKTKMRRLKQALQNDIANTQIEFGPDSGYRQTGAASQGSVPAPLLKEATPQQKAALSAAPVSGRVGTVTNPVVINPKDTRGSYANVPKGGYFLTPSGEVRGPKP